MMGPAAAMHGITGRILRSTWRYNTQYNTMDVNIIIVGIASQYFLTYHLPAAVIPTAADMVMVEALLSDIFALHAPNDSFNFDSECRITWILSISKNTNETTEGPPMNVTFSNPLPCTAFAFALSFGLASAIRKGKPVLGHDALTARHIFLSYSILLPDNPAIG